MADELYPDLDPSTLEPHYCRHVEAMTVEGLHEKSDIAIQLAWRDARIASLESQLAEANEMLEECVQYFEKLGWFEAAAKLRGRERADG